MNETITQLGIGAVFVILVLRELLPWLLKVRDSSHGSSSSNGKAGEISVAAWEMKFSSMFESHRAKMDSKMDIQHTEMMRALERIERSIERHK